MSPVPLGGAGSGAVRTPVGKQRSPGDSRPGFGKGENMSARMRVRHELKSWPEFFYSTLNGRKRFELRRDDRPEKLQVGDELLLKE